MSDFKEYAERQTYRLWKLQNKYVNDVIMSFIIGCVFGAVIVLIAL